MSAVFKKSDYQTYYSGTFFSVLSEWFSRNSRLSIKIINACIISHIWYNDLTFIDVIFKTEFKLFDPDLITLNSWFFSVNIV